MNRFIVVTVACVHAVAFCSELRGERVGFQFTGAFQGGATGTYSMYGVTFPRNSSVVGMFSYDVPSTETAADPGTRIFPQGIHGGYTLDINHGALRLSAQDYRIKVANDFPRAPEAVDLFIIEFDSRLSPTPVPIKANSVTWLGPTAFATIELSWPSSTFSDPTEPQLTNSRPLKQDFVGLATIGTGNPPRQFAINTISAIAPSDGDYNLDGFVDANDYEEWQRAFGGSGPQFGFADGNRDGVVDAADYTVWRDHSESVATAFAVPEPGSWRFAMVGVITASSVASVRSFRRA